VIAKSLKDSVDQLNRRLKGTEYQRIVEEWEDVDPEECKDVSLLWTSQFNR